MLTTSEAQEIYRDVTHPPERRHIDNISTLLAGETLDVRGTEVTVVIFILNDTSLLVVHTVNYNGLTAIQKIFVTGEWVLYLTDVGEHWQKIYQKIYGHGLNIPVWMASVIARARAELSNLIKLEEVIRDNSEH